MLQKIFNSIIILSVFKIETVELSNLTCNQNNSSIELSLLSTFHSAWDPTLNCSLSQCNMNTNDSCHSLQTPCFDYRSINNQSFCAPASLCSILEPCDNITNACPSNAFLCIVNACCQSTKVCLPLIFTQLCSSIQLDTSSTTTTSVTTTTSTQSLPGSCQLSFAPMVRYEVDRLPQAIAVGDFNNDNYIDIVASNQDYLGTISVLLGYGNGSFAPKTTYQTGAQPQGILIGDFNGDNQSDLIVANYGVNESLSIFFGHGDGSFTNQTIMPSPRSPTFGAVYDFNHDGCLDFIMTFFTDRMVSIYLGHGNGSFSIPMTFSAGYSSYYMTLGDFNNDNQIDIVVSNIEYSGVSSMSILLGYGNGSFSAYQTFASGISPYAIVTSDFNGDNNLDLAVVCASSNSTKILFGYGNGSFANPISYATGFRPFGLCLGDFNGDNQTDIATVSLLSDSVNILLGFGNGSFTTQIKFGSNITGSDIRAADFNGDGRLDLAITNYGGTSVGVFLNNC